MSIAYLVAQFPKPSETFVSREFLTLKRLGLDLKPFAFTHPDDQETTRLDAASRSLMPNVDYLPHHRLIPAAAASWRQALQGWRSNARLQELSTFKSNPHVRLLRSLALASRLRKERITHLHAHWPYATQIACQVHELTGIPYSCSIHAHEVEHDYGHFQKIFESVSFASFCNQAAMNRLLARLPLEARKRSHLVYHGVDLTRFAPLPHPGSSPCIQVLSAGRLTPTKGFDRLLRACARYRNSGGQVDLTLLGQGREEPALRKLAGQLHFTSHLHLPGWLPHDQIHARFRNAHLFALMADTNYHDGIPNVVLEAMASARPVILSPLPAASEAVRHGIEGFILNSATDEEGFIQILSSIARQEHDLPAMGLAARHRMEQVFDETVHARHLKQLFETPHTP